MNTLFKALAFVLVLASTTACDQDKSDENLVEYLTLSVNGESFEMAFVEGGTFLMGATSEQGDDSANNEKPAHEETVSAFHMSKYEVTQKLWKAVMGPKHSQSHNLDCDDCPAEQISWNDTQQFIARLNVFVGKKFRLPTEIEWEYAARGGRLSKGYKYSGSNDVDDVAWYVENYKDSKYGTKGTTHPVGMKKPNELGIYDMSGNVWEWCNNLYAKEYVQNGKTVHSGWPLAGSSTLFRRVLRGASWGGNAKGCRVSCIDYDMATYRDEYGGFRLVLEPDSVQIITN